MNNIGLTVKGLQKVLQVVEPKHIARAAASSLTRTIRAARTETSTQIRKKWKISKQDLDRKIIIRGASRGDLSASLTVRGEPISLMYFGPIMQRGQIRTYAARNRGVMPGLAQRRMTHRRDMSLSVEVMKGRRTILKKAFLILGRGGTPLIVRRLKGTRGAKGREKLAAMKVYTFASMFRKPYIISRVVERIRQRWQKEWENQIRQLARGDGWMTMTR